MPWQFGPARCPSKTDPLPLNSERSQFAKINEIFAVIAQAGEAVLAEKSAKMKRESISKLREQWRSTSRELQKATFIYETAEPRIAVQRMPLTALRATLLRELSSVRGQLILMIRQAEQVQRSAREQAAATMETRPLRTSGLIEAGCMR